MKNVLSAFLAILVIVFLSCAPEVINPVQTAQVNAEQDTIVMFDSNTFEKVVKVVVTEEESIPNAIYEVGTMITFDGETFEETMEIVRTRIISSDEGNAETHISNLEQIIKEEGDYRIDTVITFDPETFEETIHIIRFKKNKDSQKNN